ncbi:MAG: UvrD-helicase domain-containing protein [Firmicutes bacterium]|nr:UvrD-helicase domain-containing protein [Bacillota bacterium]
MPDYLDKLNQQQYEAATTVDGALLVLAGAGSGKTGTMTHRIAYMVKEKGISPWSILAVTFTNKAAKEMRERIEALIGSVNGMWIQTFHSAALRILRTDAEMIGFSKSFTVYDPVDQKAVIKNLIKEYGLDEKKCAPAYVLSEISNAKEKEIGPEAYARNHKGEFRYEELIRLYQGYDAALKNNNAMDFDDLILNTVRLFETCPQVLAQWQNKFKYIMVDEYQDTNMLQYKMIRLLAGGSGNLCVVGDDDQCIYQWRGADIRNILEFEKDFPGAKVIKLEQNYRSTGNIIEAAHSVIRRNQGRKDKKMWTRAEAGEKIEYYRAEDDREEARYTGAAIRSMMRHDPSLHYSDFAVLYRTNVQSRRFEDAFSVAGIPYQVLSGLRYYERKEIKDIMAYMRLVVNPSDDISLLRILNEPKRGVGPKAEALIREAAKSEGSSILQALSQPVLQAELTAKTRSAVAALALLLQELHDNADLLSIEEIYDTLLVKSGYLPALQEQATVEADGRIENLMEFKTVIQEKEQAYKEEARDPEAPDHLTLDAFLEGLALIADIDNKDDEQDAVVLMTLHSAKGLEFPVVFMPGMELGIFPSYRTIERNEGMEEERRLCYVGMTRAKEKLYMTGAEQRMMYGKLDRACESPFMKEIDKKYLSGHAVYDKRGDGESFARYSTSPARTYSSGAYISPLQAAKTTGSNAKSVSQLLQPKYTVDAAALAPGDKVKHDKFGEGTVIEIKGKIVTVIFDSEGTKKLAADKAPMKKI